MIDLVVMHGANGCAADVEPLAAPLRALARVHVPNLPGHGGRPLPERLSFEGNNADILALLDRGKIERAMLVGYSLGGYNALHFARRHPQRTLGVCAIATRVTMDAETVRHWTHILQAERLTREGNPRAVELLHNHGPPRQMPMDAIARSVAQWLPETIAA